MSPPPRKILPTPSRMKSQLMEANRADRASHRKRYSAVSAIPGPLPAISRNAASSGSIAITSIPGHPADSVPAHRESFHPIDGKPRSAWPTSEPHLPRSESLLPYWQRPQRDLSGVKQQLHLRHYSTHSISSPSKIGIPRDVSLTGSSLPKSHSSSSLLSPSRNVTPGRRLLKPLSPPLPKSQTFSNFSCTNLPKSTPSRTKPPHTRLPRSVGSVQSQVNVVDALRESRMTDEEIVHLKQVQRESTLNQNRMKQTFEVRQHKQRNTSSYISPTSSSFIRTPEEATLNLSANDVANTRRLEEQRRNCTSRRPLFINSVLAKSYESEPITTTPNTIISANSSKPDEEWDTNLKLVFFDAEPAYWTGRYVTICDRLQTENMRAATTVSRASTSSYESTCGPFDSTDAQRMGAALEELRACCRTEQAVKSFEVFEAQLMSTDAAAPLRHTRAGRSNLVDDDADRILKARMKTAEVPHSRPTPVTAIRASRIPTPVKADPPLPSIFTRLTLTKSKTTGNLTTPSTFGMPDLPTTKLSLPSTSHSNEAKVPDMATHNRRKSGFQTTQNAREEALKERERKAKQRAADTKRRLLDGTYSYGSIASSKKCADNSSKVTKESHPHHADASLPSSLIRFPHDRSCPADPFNDGINYRAIKSGHAQPPPRPRSPWHAQIKMLGDEKVIKSRRKSDRQSSGEIVKGFFDAGISQVKKMKRRVGGSMSWAGSAEDLNTVIGGSESGRK